jgi:four helix bundle protein
MTIESYRDLKVWQVGMDLAAACYTLTATFPRDEIFGMTSQIRRSASSVPANIAEGYGRESTGAYIQFLRTAQGSLKELETHLLLSARVGLCPEEAVAAPLDMAEELGRMLRSLIRKLQSKVKP